MSLSDFTLTSPRKNAFLNNKSITYDEEFEKFLNDTSESELSTNRYTKQEKPWWMNDDEDLKDSKQNGDNNRKSFMKKAQQPAALQSSTKLTPSISKSSKKLSTTVESDEQPDAFVKRMDETVHTNATLPKLSFDNNSSYSLRSRQSKSISDAGNEINEENQLEDVEEPDQNESSTDHLTSPESKQSVIERSLNQTAVNAHHYLQSSVPSTTPANANQDTKHIDTTLFGTNLLSKVNFIETMPETTKAGGETRDFQIPMAQQKQFQINEARTVNFNNHNDTQTRHDLDDIEQIYRNFATYTDSGLNTLIRTNQPLSTDEISFERGAAPSNQKNINFTDSIQNGMQSMNNSELGLRAIHAITSELENRALDQILKEIEKDSKKKKVLLTNLSDTSVRSSLKQNEWPPKEFKNVKSTGYGTYWSPASYVGHFHRTNSMERDSRQKTKNKSVNSMNQNTHVIAKHRSPSSHSQETRANQSVRFADNQSFVISGLKSQIVNRENEYEKNIREIRFDYEQQLNELKAKIGQLTNELNEAKDQNFKIEPISTNSHDEPIKQSIKTNPTSKTEQESLIKGYQLENERLYSDLKRLKENNKLEVQNLTEQITQLKFNFIQEKIQFDNKLKSTAIAVNKPPINTSITDNEENSQIMSQLNSKLNEAHQAIEKYSEMIRILTEKLNYYEKNERQIEIDIKVIDSQKKEIKKLNDRLKLLESGKTPVDCLKQIKQLKNQLKEMDSALKRLRQPLTPGSNAADAVSMSIDFYEKKIQELENKLKEKDQNFDRQNRFWEQKFHLYEQVSVEKMRSKSPTSRHLLPKSPTRDVLDKKLIEFESNYSNKIENLENLVQNLRKIIKEFELRLQEKQSEMNRLLNEKDAEIERLKSAAPNSKKVKIYEHKEFIDQDQTEQPAIQSSNSDLANELELIRSKLKTAEKKLKKSEYDQSLLESEIQKTKIICEKKLTDLIKKHKFELQKLLGVFIGSSNNNHAEYSDEESFSDPIQTRMLRNARDKHNEMRDTIEKQKLLLKKLNDRCTELTLYRDKCVFLEEENKKLIEQIDELKLEVNAINNSASDTPLLNHYEFLKEKIKRLEKNMAKREKDLSSVILRQSGPILSHDDLNNEKLMEMKRFYEQQLDLKNKELKKFRLEFDAMLQLLHSL